MPITLITNKAGFTLIELLMAMLILTVGLLGLLQSIEVAYHHNARNKLREEAVLLAEEEMNNFRLDPSAFHPQTTATRIIGGAGRSFNVLKSSQSIGGNSNRLTVSVRWVFKNVTAVHEIYTFKKM